jgi:hypothetical protein
VPQGWRGRGITPVERCGAGILIPHFFFSRRFWGRSRAGFDEIIIPGEGDIFYAIKGRRLGISIDPFGGLGTVGEEWR